LAIIEIFAQIFFLFLQKQAKALALLPRITYIYSAVWYPGPTAALSGNTRRARCRLLGLPRF
jgi:hypothetical protein